MKLLFLSVGKKNDEMVQEGVEEFTKRLSRSYPVLWKMISPSSRGEAGVKEEGEYILKSLEAGDYVILLDNRGREMSTPELADFLEKRSIEGRKRLVFVIGGAYGVSDDVYGKADTVWSLSKLTFPHQLVRFILVEQMYRACSIVRGEKYHHGNIAPKNHA